MKMHRSRFALAISLVAALAVPAVPAFAQQRCLQPVERTALNVKMLQSDLMVAALSCRDVPGFDYRGAYNVFMQRNGQAISRQISTLQGYFRATYGGQWQNQFDQFVAGIANEASRQSMANVAFCTDSARVLSWANQIAPESLGPSADAFAQSRGVQSSCTAQIARLR
jgi:hypothetical protein